MNLRNSSLSLIFTLLLVTCSSFNEEERKAKSLELFKDFRGQLQEELLQAVSTQGPENAIDVCARKSPEIEKRISEEQGLVIKRVSDKNRNPNNAPDDLEGKIIQKWKDELNQGIQPAVFSQKVNGEFRVMKPILIDNSTCLKCHGSDSEINPATKEKLKVVYPNDSAKGYKLGDVRGAFSASWRI
jgi:hypothetical protein